MKAIFDERQLLHDPERYFRRGAYIPHPEQPQRAVLIRDMLARNGFPIEQPRDFGLDIVKRVHDPDYVDFWKDAHERFRAEAGDAEAIPTYHPGHRPGRRSSSIYGQLGWYTTDTSTPLTAGTWEAVYWSAQTAIEAANNSSSGLTDILMKLLENQFKLLSFLFSVWTRHNESQASSIYLLCNFTSKPANDF